MSDRTELASFACDVARVAGKLLLSNLPLGRWRGDVENKAGRELVTEVDRASERLIVDSIREAFPHDSVLAEEGGETHEAEAEHRWIIDPLDGTMNFLHGHPMFAVSIAVEYLQEKEIVAGAIYAPYVDELFFGQLDGGAYLNVRTIQLQVSSTESLSDALVTTGFAYDRDRWPNYDNFLQLAKDSRGIRRCGAASIDLAYVAAGRYDAFWELGLRPYDVAAGALLVREAGGKVADFAGGDGWLSGGNIVASNAQLFDQVRDRLGPLPA